MIPKLRQIRILLILSGLCNMELQKLPHQLRNQLHLRRLSGDPDHPHPHPLDADGKIHAVKDSRNVVGMFNDELVLLTLQKHSGRIVILADPMLLRRSHDHPPGVDDVDVRPDERSDLIHDRLHVFRVDPGRKIPFKSKVLIHLSFIGTCPNGLHRTEDFLIIFIRQPVQDSGNLLRRKVLDIRNGSFHIIP